MQIRGLKIRPVRLAIAALMIAPPTLAGGVATAASAAHAGATLPAVKHVWYVDLENEGYAQSFGDPKADPYLAKTLPSEGALLKNYYAVGHNSLDNYIAQVTGQAPDLATMNDCGRETKFTAGAKFEAPFHQLVGNGCIYPASVPTLGNQLSKAHLSWKAYLQDMGNDPARDNTDNTAQGPACGHPPTGAVDPTEHATATDQYATRHEGFMYMTSVTANNAFCDAHMLSFRPLRTDLSNAATTPAFSWISPNLCMDGHDAPCANGDPGGLIEIDAFLRTWIPLIMHSPAYRQGGMILITFDEGSTSNACCGETSGKSPSHPNSAEPGMNGPGGGRVGAVVLSPFVKPGTVSTVNYNHYSALRTIEQLFGLPLLGDAAMPQVKPFGKDVFSRG